MANYFEMSKDQLRAEKAALEQSYAEFKAKGLKLNMARGKPGPHQMDLAMMPAIMATWKVWKKPAPCLPM